MSGGPNEASPRRWEECVERILERWSGKPLDLALRAGLPGVRPGTAEILPALRLLAHATAARRASPVHRQRGTDPTAPRGVPPLEGDRARRHRAVVYDAEQEPRPACGPQGSPLSLAPRSTPCRALPERGAGRGPPPYARYRPRLRRRRRWRRSLLRHAVHRGPWPRPRDRRTREAARRRHPQTSDARRNPSRKTSWDLLPPERTSPRGGFYAGAAGISPPGGRGPGPRSWRRDRPPGRETLEPAPRCPGHGLGDRLRPGESGERRASDPHGRHRRDPRLHGSRTVQRPLRPPERRLLAGRHPL